MAMKRHLPPLERDLDAVKRKKHFVVEIPSKPASHQLHNNTHKHKKPGAEATVALSHSVARPREPAPQRPPVAKLGRPDAAAAATRPLQAPVSTATSASNKPTNTNLPRHKGKVANGLKHELDRLQPAEAVAKEQGRKLRSQEATRFKSDLSAYFPDYDEVVGNDPKEHREHTVS